MTGLGVAGVGSSLKMLARNWPPVASTPNETAASSRPDVAAVPSLPAFRPNNEPEFQGKRDSPVCYPATK